jgi:tetratricopeptide (TPR) repeat protein
VNWLISFRAQYLLARNRTAEAAVLYRDLLQSDPVHVPGLIAVLVDCHERNAIDDAITVATRALTVDSKHFMALQTLGWAYVKRGDHSAARPVIAKALEQFDAQGLAEAHRALWVLDRVASRRPGAEAAAQLAAWKQWAVDYLSPRS